MKMDGWTVRTVFSGADKGNDRRQGLVSTLFGNSQSRQPIPKDRPNRPTVREPTVCNNTGEEQWLMT